MNYYKKDQLIALINQMNVREKDFPIIKALLSTKDPSLISAITEEVLKGNLYWSDLDECLPREKYDEVLNNVLPTQNALLKRISAIAKFNKFAALNEEQLNEIISKTGIVKRDDNLEEYNTDVDNLRADLLASIYTIDVNDNAVERAAKIALMNLLMNGENLKNLSDEELRKYKIQNNTITNTETNETYKYIDPNDILLWASDFIIPIDENMIVLTDWDVMYMKLHNITEDNMKKIIAASKTIIHAIDSHFPW